MTSKFHHDGQWIVRGFHPAFLVEFFFLFHWFGFEPCRGGKGGNKLTSFLVAYCGVLVLNACMGLFMGGMPRLLKSRNFGKHFL